MPPALQRYAECAIAGKTGQISISMEKTDSSDDPRIRTVEEITLSGHTLTITFMYSGRFKDIEL